MNCKDCRYKRESQRFGNRTKSVTCENPNKEYIRDYFEKNRISKMEGFLGFIDTKGNFPVKKSPKWCPLKAEKENENA